MSCGEFEQEPMPESLADWPLFPRCDARVAADPEGVRVILRPYNNWDPRLTEGLLSREEARKLLRDLQRVLGEQ